MQEAVAAGDDLALREVEGQLLKLGKMLQELIVKMGLDLVRRVQELMVKMGLDLVRRVQEEGVVGADGIGRDGGVRRG